MRYFPPICSRLIAVCLVGLATASASLELREIGFNKKVYPGGDDPWLECVVEIEVLRDPRDAARRDPEFIDGVEVDLLMAFEVKRRARNEFEFYQATARLVAVQEGRALIRFYLPPEIVERDSIGSEPHSFLVRGRRGELLLVEAHSRSLARSSARESFLKRINDAASRNEGILLPQNQTPFSVLYPRSTPSHWAAAESKSSN